MEMPQGDRDMQHGDMVMQLGDMVMQHGDRVMQHGDLVMQLGCAAWRSSIKTSFSMLSTVRVNRLVIRMSDPVLKSFPQAA
jgi:hypothetical protein